MGYTKRIVCLAKSLKYGGICIAGRELTPQGIAGWIRPISFRPSEELTYLEYRYQDGSSPKLLDVIDIPLMAHSPRHHQIENHLIDASQPWIKQREILFRQVRHLVEDPPVLWSNEDHTSHGIMDCLTLQQATRHRCSLYLIQNSSFTIEVGRSSSGGHACRGVFDHHGVQHNLSITDPILRDRYEDKPIGHYPFGNSRPAYLCVSLTEPYKWDKRCHKLIAAVITDPPLQPSA